jgi:hypothetical protein
MYGRRHNQQGMTLISWLLVLGVGGVLLLGALRLAPVYMENFSVKSSLKSLQNDPDFRGNTVGELRASLKKRLDINDVTRVHSEDIAIERKGSVYHITVAYEAVVPFLYNIRFLVEFEEVVEVVAR